MRVLKERNNKRLGSYVVILVLIFSLFIPEGGVVAEGDISPPTLNNLTISKTSVGPGDIVKFSGEFSDDLSGVDSAYIMYKSPDGERTRYFWLNYDTTSGNYEGQFEVGIYDPEGTWTIDYLYLIDNQDNSYRYFNGIQPGKHQTYEYKDFSSYDISVSGTTPDKTPPVLNDLMISKSDSSPGSNVKISAGITDDLSGVTYATIQYKIPHNGGYKFKNIYLAYNSTTDKYEGEFKTEEFDPSGTWEVDYLTVIDKFNQYIYYNGNLPKENPDYEYKDFSAYGISVSGTKMDVIRPTLSDLRISHNDAVTGDIVKLSAIIKDDLSGIDTAFIIYKSPNENKIRYVPLYNNPSTGRFEGEFEVGKYVEEGTWKIYYIYIGDNQNNHFNYYNSAQPYEDEANKYLDLSGFNITVSYADRIAPSTAISINSESDKIREWYNSEVNISFNAIDEKSGVRDTFYRINKGDWTKYQDPIILIEASKYFIDYKSIDNEGNEEPVKTATIRIDNTPPVTTPYVDRNEFIELKAIDDYSGVKKLEYRIDNGEWVPYNGPVNLEQFKEKRYLLETRSMDFAGNEEEVKAQEFMIDRTAPITSIYGLEDHWFNTDVTLTLDAYDALSGVYFTEIRVNQEQLNLYDTPITFTQEGINYLYYRSFDNFKNIEELKIAKVLIDKTAPTMNLSFNQSVITDRSHKLVAIKVTVDIVDELSGFASFELVSIESNQSDNAPGSGNTLDDIQDAEYGTPDTEFLIRAERGGKEDRVYSVTYKAIDNAGNEVFKTETITVKHDNSSK